ncbi:MAG: hypothetical protein V1703_01370 [Candidatus Altiarchaeota archaeon]
MRRERRLPPGRFSLASPADLPAVGAPKEAPEEVMLLGKPPLAVRPDGHSENYKPCVLLRTPLVPIDMVSCSDGTHAKSFTQAFPVILWERVRRGMPALTTREEQDELADRILSGEGYVPCVIIGRGDGVNVAIRPDYPFYRDYRRAIDVLRRSHPSVTPDKIKIMSVTSRGARDMAKCMGLMHMVIPLEREEDGIADAVKSAERVSPTGNRYFRAERVSYMSSSQLADILSDIGDRDRFRARLGEIIHLYMAHPQTEGVAGAEGAIRQLDFLLMTKKRTLNPDTGFIFDGLREIADDAERARDWSKASEAIEKKFKKVLADFERKNNPRFNQINPDDMPPEVSQTLYRIIANIKSEEEVLELGQEFKGYIQPLPGGYMPGREYPDLLESYMRPSDLPKHTKMALDAKKALHPFEPRIVIMPEETRGECASVQVFQIGGGETDLPQGMVLRTRWDEKKCVGEHLIELNEMLAGNPKMRAYTPGLDVAVSDLPPRTRARLRELQVEHSGDGFIVISPEDVGGEMQSVQTFQVKGVPEGRVVWKYFEFDENATQATKDSLNLILKEHPALRCAYLCGVTGSVSRRDKSAMDVRYGIPDRDVSVRVFIDEEGLEVRELERRTKWNAVSLNRTLGVPMQQALVIARQYEFNILDRVEAITWLCANAQLPLFRLHHTTEDVPGFGGVKVGHFTRTHVKGTATNRVMLHRYRRKEFVEGLLECKGRMAADKLVMGAAFFDDGDEIISQWDKGGNPEALTWSDPTGSFRHLDTPMEHNVGLFACSLAGDLIKHCISRSFWHKPLIGGSWMPRKIAANFYREFEKELLKVQDRYKDEESRGFSNRLIESRSRRDVAKAREEGDRVSLQARENPPYLEWDMRDNWRKTLKRLDDTDIGEVVGSLKKATRRIFQTGFRVIKGRGMGMSEQAELLDLFTRVVAMNHQNLDQVLGVFNRDRELRSQGFEGRLQKINALRVSTWLRQAGFNPNEVREQANVLLAGGSEEQAIQRLSGRYQLSEEMAGVFLGLARDPQLYSKLEGNGYIVKSAA